MTIDDSKQALLSAIARAIHSFDATNGELAYLAMTSKCELAVRDRIAFELHKANSAECLVGREFCLPGDLRKSYLAKAELRWKSLEAIDPSGMGSRLKGNADSPAGAIGVKGGMDLAMIANDGTPFLLLETKAEYAFDSHFLHEEGKPYFGRGMQRGIELDLLRSRCFAEALDVDPGRCFLLIIVFDAAYRGDESPDEWRRLGPVISYLERHRKHASNTNICRMSEFLSDVAAKSTLFGAVKEVEMPTARFNAGRAFGFDVTLTARLLQLA